MQGSAKYGGVVLFAVRKRDNLVINVGTAKDYKIGRQHATLLLASSSAYRSVQIRDPKGHRIATVQKTQIGERKLD